MRRAAIVIASIASGAVVVATPAAAGSYTFTELVVPGSAAHSTVATAINGKDEVVGYAITSNAPHVSSQGFSWASGHYDTYTTTGTAHPVAVNQLFGVNNAGIAVGFAGPNTVFGVGAVTRRVSSVLQRPGRKLVDEPFSSFVAIDDAGAIAGEEYTRQSGPGSGIAIYYQFGFVQKVLPPGATSSTFVAMNNAGTALGVYDQSRGVFTYNPGTIIEIPLPHGYKTAGGSISDEGGIAGGVLYQPPHGTFQELAYEIGAKGFIFFSVPGAAGANGVAVNDQGYFGIAYVDRSFTTSHGFVRRGGIFHTLDFPGATSTAITAVNANGDFVGSYQDRQFTSHAFVAICPPGQEPCTQ